MLERLRCISSTEVCVGPSVTGIPPILLLATKIIPYRWLHTPVRPKGYSEIVITVVCEAHQPDWSITAQ